jgi:hypothetical protein
MPSYLLQLDPLPMLGAKLKKVPIGCLIGCGHYGAHFKGVDLSDGIHKRFFTLTVKVFTLDEACDGIVHGYIVGIILFKSIE